MYPSLAVREVLHADWGTPTRRSQPANLTINLQRDGQVKISWDNEGDYQNPYFGGWEIYRKEIFRFSYPFESEAQFNSATFGYHVLDVSSDTQEWQDPNQWEQGTCLSYLVMAHNRAESQIGDSAMSAMLFGTQLHSV